MPEPIFASKHKFFNFTSFPKKKKKKKKLDKIEARFKPSAELFFYFERQQYMLQDIRTLPPLCIQSTYFRGLK